MARRALDYLVGFNISPILWTKLPGSKSAGRVQSVALKLITEREHEIESFKPEEFWTLSINFIDKNNQKKVESILKKNSVHFDLLGEITEKEIIINDEPTFTVDKLTEFYKGWLYKYMS